METGNSHTRTKQTSLGIPIAIVIASLVIAGAIYFSNGGVPEQIIGTGSDEPDTDITVAPVTEEDHILGNPNAPIMLVEYSDYDCPFCKNFHDTMNRIMNEYGQDGQVAWVFRHFPIEQLHPNAPRIAIASECVAELGGNDSFWTFSDLVFDRELVTTSSGGQTYALTDMSRLPEFAETAGIERGAFENCLSNNTHTEKIEADFNSAVAAGGRGTPHTIVLVNGEVVRTINGAQPYATVNSIVEGILGAN